MCYNGVLEGLIKECMKRFNWQMASIEELAVEIQYATNTRISQQLFHYRKQKNDVMLDRLSKAMKLCKLWSLEEQVKTLKVEIGLIDD